MADWKKCSENFLVKLKYAVPHIADTGNSGDVLVLSGEAVGWKITDLDDDTRACQAESDRIGELIRKRKGIRSKEEIKAVVSFREWLHGSNGWFDDPFSK